MKKKKTYTLSKYKNGGLVQDPPPATAQDSLDVYNQSMKLYNYYLSKPDLYEYDKLENSTDYQAYRDDYSKQNLTEYYNTNTGSIVDNINNYKNNNIFNRSTLLGSYPVWEKSNNINTVGDLASLGKNAEKVFNKYEYDSNKQPVYDYITGALDFAAPYMLEDKRIEPQGFAEFRPALDRETNSIVHNPGNRVILPLYDPKNIYPKSKGSVPAEAVRMSKLLNNEKLFNNSANAANYTPNMSTDWGAVLRAEGKDGSYNSRKKMYYDMGLDSEYGEYKGSAEQNLAALDRYRNPIEKTSPTSKESTEPVKSIKETKMPKKSLYSIRIHGKDYPYSTKEEYYKIIKDKNLPKEWGDAYINPEVLQMKFGGIPYGQIGALAGQLTTLAPDKEYGYGMNASTIAEGAVSKGLGLAGQGAAIGTMIAPGIGTAIGAGLGFVGGAIAGGLGADKQQNQIEDAMSARKGIRTANPYGMVAEDGGMANTPMINIERGELEVDLSTGEIVREFNKGYSKHSKNSKKEDPNNFVQAKPNTMIIPRKYAEEYKKNPKSRMGTIRDLANKQVDRELYGEDADGNRMEMAKLPEDVMMAKYGGIPKYNVGGISPLYPYPSPFSNTIEEQKALQSYGFDTGGMDGIAGPKTKQARLDAQNLPLAPGMNPFIKENINAFSFTTNEPLNIPLYSQPDTPYEAPFSFGEQSEKGLIANANLGAPLNLDYKTSPAFSSNNTDLSKTTPKDSLWTTGNTIGAIGTGIGGLSPLITTLARGIDRDERNPFMGVENAAVNELEGVFRRGKARTMDEISRSFNAANDYISNTRMSGASRLANMQGLASRRANALASAGTNYDLLQARTRGQMRLQGDSMEAQGLERMDDRLDRNRDNFYSNVNQDLVNLGQNTAFFGGMLNKQQGNEVRLNILKQISPYFGTDAAGNITFKGIPVSQEEIRRIEESVTG